MINKNWVIIKINITTLDLPSSVKKHLSIMKVPVTVLIWILSAFIKSWFQSKYQRGKRNKHFRKLIRPFTESCGRTFLRCDFWISNRSKYDSTTFQTLKECAWRNQFQYACIFQPQFKQRKKTRSKQQILCWKIIF